MRKFIALALLAGAVLVLPTFAGAVPNDVKGPPCADVIAGGGSTGGVVVDLAAAPCSYVSYTLVVYDNATSTTPLRTATPDPTFEGDPTSIAFQVGADGPDQDGQLCVLLITSVGGGKHAFDIAPDPSIGCVLVDADFSPGFGGFN